MCTQTVGTESIRFFIPIIPGAYFILPIYSHIGCNIAVIPQKSIKTHQAVCEIVRICTERKVAARFV